MNKINNVISRIIITLILAVLISNIARCQIVDNWQKNNASRDSINLSMDAKPLTYYPNYEFDQSLDEVTLVTRRDGKREFINIDSLPKDPLIKRIDQLQRELNFLGSEYQDLIIKIHELRIENDRLYHKIENLNKMVYKLYR